MKRVCKSEIEGQHVVGRSIVRWTNRTEGYSKECESANSMFISVGLPGGTDIRVIDRS